MVGEGVDRIHLKAFNRSRYEELSKNFTLQPAMQADFSYAPIAVDQDQEIPFFNATDKEPSSAEKNYYWTITF